MKAAERTMNPSLNAYVRLIPTIAAAAKAAVQLGLLLALGLTTGLNPAQAQNAAQIAALAKLSHAPRVTHPRTATSGSEATQFSLDQPSALAYDTQGDLFIADTAGNLILEVDLNGVVSIVAGSGAQGFGGDGGPATAALLDSPLGVAVDALGNVYIADTHNRRIRMVSGGVISTIAGTGVAGFSGDGAAATTATLARPTALALDSNANLYIADTDNNRIRMISAGVISTVAGNGQQSFSGDGGLAINAGLDSPSGVSVDTAFNIYISDTHNQRIREVNYATGIIATIAGTGVAGFNSDGNAASTQFDRPTGLAVDSTGTVYVADTDNQRIRTLSSGQITTVVGSGQQGNSGDTGASTSITLDSPLSVAVFGASLAVADTNNQAVQVVTDGAVNTVAGTQPTQTELLLIGGAPQLVYGSGSITATFSNGSNAATGTVSFYDGLGASPALLGSSPLSANTATLNTSHLAAGIHYIVASYTGDANNTAITSGVFVLAISPLPLTAIAQPVSLLYGQTVPTLTGTLSGVLPQDAGQVSAVFTTAATSTSAPASYPIAVALSGSAAGNYTVTPAASSGSVVIAQAPSDTTLIASSTAPVQGVSFTLTATVASSTTGTPAGTVSFYDGSALLNATPAPLTAGVGAVTLTTLTVGAHSFTATYSGSADFLASTSAALSSSVLTPDFTVASSTPAQNLVPGKTTSYTIALTPINPTFVYPVSLSVAGLPFGVTAAFAPASLPAGSAAATTTLTLSANAQAQLRRNNSPMGTIPLSAMALALLSLTFSRRLRKAAQRFNAARKLLLALLALTALAAVAGCGGSGFFSQARQTYTVTVTATSGPATHSTPLTLTLE